ncbi:PspC domain-containing protein [Arthrobacter sp. JZ12]|uniref:PspC domain-containing protein n=1 Tax=Arthrobacter sp. JZ12 TaxID=2654190 RepID=UPI002B490361|nr:PspC domain-containing protein [Arthrobacter sp. JZ12]
MNSHQDPSTPSGEPKPSAGSDSAPGSLPRATPPSEPTPEPTPEPSPEPFAQPTPHPTSQSSTRPEGGFFGWVRSLNTVRGQDRWIGGVTTGIAARTGLDPTLTRGIFVVLAIFGGIGLLLYGVAWALLPEPDGRIHAESAGRGSWTSGMTGALIVTLLGLWRPEARVFGNTGGFGAFVWSLFWIALAIFIVYWISTAHRKKNDGGSSPADSSPAGSAAASSYSPGTSYTVPTSTAEAPSASPRTSPTASMPFPPPPPTIPVKTPPKPAAPRPSGADVAVFLGGALFLGALVLVLDHLDVLALGVNAIPVALATGLVVIGLGIILLGVRGRSSGALGFLAAIGIAAALISSTSPTTGNWVVADESAWTNATGNPSEGYSVVAGQGRVDLTGIENLTEDVVVPIHAAAGNVGVLVSEDVPVEVRSRMALGSIDLVTPGDSTSLGGIWQPGTLRLNEDAAGPSIILDVRGAVSHVTVATYESALEDTESRRDR